MGEAKRRRAADGTPIGDERVALAWHYTDLVRAVFIMEDGFLEASSLNPHGVGILTTGRRVVWFTVDRRGERSGSCGQAERDFGIPRVRFGLPLAETLPAREGCLAAAWGRDRIEEDESLGRRMGADPASWRVVIADTLPVAGLTPPEVWQGARWQPFDPAALIVRRCTVTDGSMPDFRLVRGYGIDLFVVPGTSPRGERAYTIRSAKGKLPDLRAPALAGG